MPTLVATLHIPRNESVETTDGLRVSYSRSEERGANKSPYISLSCVGLPTLRKALETGESMTYRHPGRVLGWQATLTAVSDETAVLSVATLPLKTVEWYQLSQGALRKLLSSHYEPQGLVLTLRFYKSVIAEYIISALDRVPERRLSRAEAVSEIVKIVFPGELVVPWDVEGDRSGGETVRIGVVRDVKDLAECIVDG